MTINTPREKKGRPSSLRRRRGNCIPISERFVDENDTLFIKSINQDKEAEGLTKYTMYLFDKWDTKKMSPTSPGWSCYLDKDNKIVDTEEIESETCGIRKNIANLLADLRQKRDNPLPRWLQKLVEAVELPKSE